MGGLHGGGPWYAKEIAMATQSDYAVGTAALIALEQQIVTQRRIPPFLLPSQADLNTYASQAAKVVIDAVDAGRKGSVVA